MEFISKTRSDKSLKIYKSFKNFCNIDWEYTELPDIWAIGIENDR